ncbi:MAG TPA: alpha/beta fold hydrolase [Pseudonocardiaceae bacterium]|nr:alpha/beta fold hydrolase [Pseudonocardiaceae bacterium]
MRRVVARAWPPALGAAVVTLALVAGCTVGPSQRPGLVVAGNPPVTSGPGSSSARPLPGLDRPSSNLIGWSDCTSTTRERLGATTVPAGLKFQCARVLSALDSPSAPGEGYTRLELLRVGNGPTPLVVLNDLDGLPGTLYAATLAAVLPSAFLRTFALVGVDRRGTGASDPVHCVPEDDRAQIVGYDPTDTDLSGLLDASRDASQQCILALDTRSAALDITRTAEDLETIRQELGVSHLDAIGHGEGSRVLTTYADTYPGQVGRFVLDGAPDPTVNATDAVTARAASAEAAFTAFAAQCVQLNCPLAPNPKAVLTQLLGQLRSQPLDLPDGTEITNGTAVNAVLAGLAAPRSGWPALAGAIAAARTGDGTGLATLVEPMVSGTQTDPARLDARLVSGCNDQTDRLAPDQVSAAMKSLSAKYPLFGGVFAQSLLLCGPWPVPNRQLAKPTAKGAPPILVLSTANDPVTPVIGSQRTAQQLDSGLLVNWLGSGHGALGQSSCTTRAAQAFLIDGHLPANPTTCPP